MNKSEIADHITELLPALTRRCTAVAGDFEPADLTQEAIAGMLGKAQVDPAFTTQKPAYQVQYGVWTAKHMIDREMSREADASLDQPLNIHALDRPSDDFEDLDFHDVLPASDLSPEDALIQREGLLDLVRSVRKLSPSNQVVVKMLGQGLPESEIADALHISRPAVSRRKRTIATALRQFAQIQL